MQLLLHILIPAEILMGPDTQVTESGATVWFTCHTIGTPTWVINGSETQPQAYGRYERRGFNFSHVHISTWEYLTISVVASLDINNTDIQCLVFDSDFMAPVDRSQTVKLIIASESLPNSCILQRYSLALICAKTYRGNY